jgi:uncharacterized protein YkwD
VRRLSLFALLTALFTLLAANAPAQALTPFTVTATWSASTITLGQVTRLAGRVTPSRPGQAVRVERYYAGGWHASRLLTLNATSSYSFSWKPGAVGSYPLRVVKPAAGRYGTGISPTRTLRVNRVPAPVYPAPTPDPVGSYAGQCTIAPPPADPDAPPVDGVVENSDPRPTPVLSPTLPTPLSVTQSYAARLITLINQERTSRGLLALPRTVCADANAARWAPHMATTRTLVHQSMTTVQAELGDPLGVGENIAYDLFGPEDMVAAWMNSAVHRSNILGAGWNATGIAVSRSTDGKFWATQEFGFF